MGIFLLSSLLLHTPVSRNSSGVTQVFTYLDALEALFSIHVFTRYDEFFFQYRRTLQRGYYK